MEEPREHEEASATERATGNLSQELLSSSPDVADLENQITRPVDEITSAGDLEPLTQYPETVIRGESPAVVAGYQESEVPKLPETEVQSTSENNRIGYHMSINKNQASEISMQDTPPNLVDLGLAKDVTDKVLESLPQDLETLTKNDNDETDCKKLKVPKSTIDDIRPNSEKTDKQYNFPVDESQIKQMSMQDALPNLADLSFAQKVTDKVLESLTQDLETLTKIDNDETDCKKLGVPKSTIDDIRPNSEKTDKQYNFPVDESQIKQMFMQDELANLADLTFAEKVTDKVLESLPQDLETLTKNDNDETDCKKLEVPKSTIDEIRPSSEKTDKQYNFPVDENQIKQMPMQDALAKLADLTFAEKVTDKVLESLPQDLETLTKNDNHETDCKKSKEPTSTIDEILQNSERTKKKYNLKADGNQAQAISIESAPLFSEEIREIGPAVENTVRPSTLSGLKSFEEYYAGASNVISTVGKGTDESKRRSKMFEGVKKKWLGIGRKSKKKVPTEIIEEAEFVELVHTPDGPVLTGRTSADIRRTTSTGRDRNPNPWGFLSCGLCCGFKKCKNPMSGLCSTGRSYQRLESGLSRFEFRNLLSRVRRRGHVVTNNDGQLVDNERQAEVTFYNDDMTSTKIIVEKNLRIVDLCELLRVKNMAEGGVEWAIVEAWHDLGIERLLEDHEDILATYRENGRFTSKFEGRFYFRRVYHKYELFVNPKQFFPSYMISFSNDIERSDFGNSNESMRMYLQSDDAETPQVFSRVWIYNYEVNVWAKAYMLLQDRKLYTMKRAIFPTTKRFLKSFLMPPMSDDEEDVYHSRSASAPAQHSSTGAVPKRTLKELEPDTTFAHLSDYTVYTITNARKHFKAPFDWCACLRPSSNPEAEDIQTGVPGLRIISFGNETTRNCWLTAMRLAKYGKQLRENYKAFKNKQCEQNKNTSPRYPYNVENDSVWSRVAMDFTGSSGKIVTDPQEAQDVARTEGRNWRMNWRPSCRPRSGNALLTANNIDEALYAYQPWYHRDLNREVAASIIREKGVDGMYLVRKSKSHPGAYVLTHKFGEKVFHTQITPMFDVPSNRNIYTLDKGATRFYDLPQLVQFYQLNSGSLPARLTHWIPNRPGTRAQRSGSGRAPAMPPAPANQNISPRSGPPNSSSGI